MMGARMRLINPTVFPIMSFDHWDADGREITVVILKATLLRQGDGWTWPQKQPPILFEDQFAGDPATAPLLTEQEIAPTKPATDITLRAIAYTPGGKELPDWPVEVSIPERLSYGFHVRGPTQWRRRMLRGWRLDDPQPVRQVPIDYCLAYGGSVHADGNVALHPFNPSGLGFVTEDQLQGDEPIAAPQIGLLPELMRGDIRVEMAVHGFGPIARTWLPRRAHSGTYDDGWLATRHPRLPTDFDPRYWNAAPGSLQIHPHLRGDEEIWLRNLHPTKPDYRLHLPGVVPVGTLSPSGQRVDFALDTLCLDVTGVRESEHGATLVWRANFLASESYSALKIDMLRLRKKEEVTHGQ